MERVREPIQGRIAVCAADELIRRRVELVLDESGHELVAGTESIEALVESLPECEPSLVVLCCELEPFASVADFSALRLQLAGTPLVVVASGFLGTGPRRLFRAGAEGIVMEPDIEESLVAAIDAVLADHLCVPKSMREEIARPVFSHREKQILELVVRGLTNGEIAGRLYLSESTVKSHLASSFRKLGVSSRAQAVERVLDPDSGLDLVMPGEPAVGNGAH